MARHEDEETTRKHIHVFVKDWEELEHLFGQTIGVSKAIRTIIRGYLKGLGTRSESGQKRITTELELEEEEKSHEQ